MNLLLVGFFCNNSRCPDVVLSKGTSRGLATLSFEDWWKRNRYCNPWKNKACGRHIRPRGLKKGGLGCLHPVGHFRHALRHVASVAPCTLASSFTLRVVRESIFLEGPTKISASVQSKGLYLNIR